MDCPKPSFARRAWRVFASVVAIAVVAAALVAAAFLGWAHARRGRFLPKHPGFVRFALCQYDSRSGDTRRNILHALEYADEAVRHGADVVILPEFSFATVHDVRSKFACFNLLERPELAGRLSDFTRRNGCYLLYNHPLVVTNESPKKLVYNQSCLLGPDGAVVVDYCKQAMALIDIRCGITPGTEDVVARLPFGNLGLMICKDAYYPNHFPSFQDADVVVIQFAHIVNWGPDLPPNGLREPIAEAPRNFPHVANLCTSALRKPLLMVNKTGLEDTYAYIGGSRVVIANGMTIAQANSYCDILYADFILNADGRIDPNQHPVIPEAPVDYETGSRWSRLRRSLLRLAARVP